MLILTSGGNYPGKSKGIPTPKFTFMPDLTYLTNLLAILNFALSKSVNLLAEVGSGLIGYFSIIFLENIQFLSCLMILST
jgi:hypothetical protein